MKSISFVDTSAAVKEGNKEWEAFSNDNYTVRKDENEVAYMPCNLKLGDSAESNNGSGTNGKPLRLLLKALEVRPMDEDTLSEQWMAVISRVEEKMAGAVCLKNELGKLLSTLDEFSERATGSTTTYLSCMDMFRNIGSMRISISTSDLGSQGKKICERIIGCVLNMAGLEEDKTATRRSSTTGHHSFPFCAKNFDESSTYWDGLQKCFQAKLYIVQVHKGVLQVVKCMSGPTGGGHDILGISSLGPRSRYAPPRLKD